MLLRRLLRVGDVVILGQAAIWGVSALYLDFPAHGIRRRLAVLVRLNGNDQVFDDAPHKLSPRSRSVDDSFLYFESANGADRRTGQDAYQNIFILRSRRFLCVNPQCQTKTANFVHLRLQGTALLD